MSIYLDELNEGPREPQDNASPIQAQIVAVSEQSRGLDNRLMEAITRAMSRVKEDARPVRDYLADRGWYLPAGELDIGAFSRFRHFISESRNDEIEEFMQDFTRSRIDEILAKVRQHWPNRFPFLHDSFEAHRQHKYTLSVPVILAQADGISYDVLNETFFGKRYGKPKTGKALDNLLSRHMILGRLWPLGETDQILLESLREPSSVLEDTKDIDERRHEEPEYGPLNRHGVLHGRDVKYDTEPNSLRAILLIGYLIEVHEILVRHEEHVCDIKRTLGELGNANESAAG